LIDFFKELV